MLSREISTYGHTKRVYRKPGSCGIFVEAEEHKKKKKVKLFVAESSQLYETWKLGQSKEREKGPKREDRKAFFFFLKQPRLILFLCVFTLSLI